MARSTIHAPLRGFRVLAAAAILLVLAVPPALANGFVYIAVPAPACTAPPCVPPELHVYDAATMRLVMRLPLPVYTEPAGIAMSPDGSRVYVSNRATGLDGVTSLSVMDARRHVLVGTYPTAAEAYGRLAVRHDGSRVYIAFPHTNVLTNVGQLHAFDVQARAVVGTVRFDRTPLRIEASSSIDRVYLAFGVPFKRGDPPVIVMYDGATVFELMRSIDLPFAGGLSISRDGLRLYTKGREHPESPDTQRLILDAATLTVTSTTVSNPGVDFIEVQRTGDLLTVAGSQLLRFSSPSAPDPAQVVELGASARSFTVTDDETRVFVSTSGETPAVVAIDLNTHAVVDTLPVNAAQLTSTPPGAQACRYRLASRYASFAMTGGMHTLQLTTTCAWQASSEASWARLSTTAGDGNATLTIQVDPNDLPTPRTTRLTLGGQLVTVTQAGWLSQPPFGAFETPQDGTGNISGSLAVTGWALDDVGVARVEIWRDPVEGEGTSIIHVGDATFVEGARPDVQGFLPDAPFASRAGWGLMVLTNALPNGGNGMVRLHAFVTDVEGHQSVLGTHTMFVDNASAGMPFGAIDTPGQGATVSGTILNWGWALTPGLGFTIPPDGSTIDVVVDGVVVGHPTYGLFRADIAALFPGYTNSNSGVGYLMIDTTTLSNGMHSIAWVVRDSAGRAAGIGSRFFHVFNP